jgi:hypothetical protein
MKQKQKDKASVWRTKDILLAIPKIENILKKTPKIHSYYRSISESSRFTVQTELFPLKSPIKKSPPILKSKLNQNYEFTYDNQSLTPCYTSLHLVDQNLQVESKYLNFVYNKTQREPINIPVINIEKSTPRPHMHNSLTKNSGRRKESLKHRASSSDIIETQVPKVLAQEQTCNKTRTVFKRYLHDESNNHDFLLTQSSRLITESPLTAHFFPVFPTEKSNLK